MYDSRNTVIAADLNFALDVLQESSHLGLDSEYSAKIKAVIEKQLRRRQAAPAVPAPAPELDECAA